jgi:hypothetical protein
MGRGNILGISFDAAPASSIRFPNTMNCVWKQACQRHPAHFRLMGAATQIGRRTVSSITRRKRPRSFWSRSRVILPRLKVTATLIQNAYQWRSPSGQESE